MVEKNQYRLVEESSRRDIVGGSSSLGWNLGLGLRF
jgi:hypothetical protein